MDARYWYCSFCKKNHDRSMKELKYTTKSKRTASGMLVLPAVIYVCEEGFTYYTLKGY